MTIDFRSINIASKPALTTFSDSLLRATAIGVNWMVGFTDSSQASWFTPTVGETITGLQLSNATGGGSSASMLILPVVLGAIIGQTQFAEVIFVSTLVNFPSAGPCVAAMGDPISGTANGYFANIQPPNNFLQIRVCNVGQRLVQDNIGTSVAVGVKVRIACTFGATANTIQCWVNNVSQGSFVDNNALRPTTGLPGIYFKGAAAGSNIKFSSFRGGQGLGG